MLQAIIKKGQVKAETIPAPMAEKGTLLIKVINSCISIGTELKTVESSKKTLIRKSIEDPEKLKKAFHKILHHDYKSVYQKVVHLNKKSAITMEAGKPSGYSLSGIVIAVGEGISNFQPGDHVAAAGAGKAHHAEFVEVPVNLVVKMPPDVSFEDASSVAIGSIAMQGVRRADLQVGEFCVVYGVGLIGYITLQILNKSGIRTIAIDIDNEKLQIAEKLGAEMILNPLSGSAVGNVLNYTGGNGVDAVIYTASTQDEATLSDSLKMVRTKGRFVLVGVAGDKVKREDLYSKEIDFLISTSYGPGRYDANYEEKGMDYPYGYVRWTENRNMAEFLRLIQTKNVTFNLLHKRIFAITEISQAFGVLQQKDLKPSIVIVSYQNPDDPVPEISSKIESRHTPTVYPSVHKEIIQIGFAGVGNFSLGTHLPNIAQLADKYRIKAVMNRSGHKAKYVMDKFGADFCTTNYDDIIADPEINLVMICNNHRLHADYAYRALAAGKNVFVEKPLATCMEELDLIKTFYSKNTDNRPMLMVGYNRRFSPFIRRLHEFTSRRINPLIINYRMNAGQPPLNHWVYTEGGRIIGEACHIFDLFSYLTDAAIDSVHYNYIDSPNDFYLNNENIQVTVKYKDGSICTLSYFSLGSKELSKEYMEVHFDGKSFLMDDYKTLKGYGIKFREIKSSKQEKGHREELKHLHDALTGKQTQWPISLESMMETTELTFGLV